MSSNEKEATRDQIAAAIVADVDSEKTQWHLKKGDGTSVVHASRIYFYKFVLEKVPYVLVLHVGPHPDDDKTYTVSLDMDMTK